MTFAAPLLHHEIVGPPGAPLLVLGPSLGTSSALWDPQLHRLAAGFRVLRYDLPGHGGSPAEALRDPAPGRTSVGDLAGLVLDLVDTVTAEGDRGRFHYAGISLGGAIGSYLAVHQPDRILSLSSVCSSARFGEPGPWRERAALVREEGMAPVLASSAGRWFADPESAASPRGRALLAGLAATDPAGYAACCDALAAYDLRPALGRITAPTLVVAGSRDVATPLDHARELADGIEGAGLTVLDMAHLAVERPIGLGRTLAAHLAGARPVYGDVPVGLPAPAPHEELSPRAGRPD